MPKLFSEDKQEAIKVRGLDPVRTSTYKNIHLIIGISVGSEKLQDTPLLALINKINEISERVKDKKSIRCTFAVCDTLQMYNYMIDGKTDEKSAYNEAKIAGDKWIEQNIKIINKLKVPHEEVRWDTWKDEYKNNTKYEEKFSTLLQDSSFESAISESIAEFSDRFKERFASLEIGNSIDNESLKKCCRRYLLEECAIIMQMWPDTKEQKVDYQCILYPSKMTKALDFTYNHLVKDKNVFQWVKFYFKNLSKAPNVGLSRSVFFKPITDTNNATHQTSDNPQFSASSSIS